MGALEIVVLVVVVALVASRFFAFKLPHDPRPKAARKGDFARMFKRHIPTEPKTDMEVVEEAKTAKKKQPPVVKVSAEQLAVMSGLEKIKALEPGFTEKRFLERARVVQGQLQKAFNARDEAGLVDICAPRLVDELVARWEKNSKAKMDEKIEAVRVGEARVTGRTAFVEAVFDLGRKQGAAKRSVSEVWLLARPLGGDDAQWEIQNMKEKRA